MISYNNRLCSCLVILFCWCLVIQPCRAADQNRGDENSAKSTETERQAVYDSLPSGDKTYIDSLPPEERTRALDNKVKYRKSKTPTVNTKEEAQFSGPVVIRSDKDDAYELDPHLKKAYLAYLDPKTPRTEIISLFEKYIEKEPKSVFLPETYFRIGTLYCIHRKRKLSESYKPELAAEYYEKAHKLYGDRFSHAHRNSMGFFMQLAHGNLRRQKGLLRLVAKSLTKRGSRRYLSNSKNITCT